MDHDVGESTKSATEVNLIAAYKDFFRSQSGQLVFNDLYDFCLRHLGSYSESSNLLSFEEGKRCIFARILRMAEINLSAHMKQKITKNNIYDY